MELRSGIGRVRIETEPNSILTIGRRQPIRETAEVAEK
jgi:hypothetical protein